MVEALSVVSSHATFTRLLGTYASGIARRDKHRPPQPR
jgi:hypothetical protein